MQTLNSEEKKLAEFACKVCRSKFAEENPQAVGCAWRSLDNEYCPHVMESLRPTEADIIETSSKEEAKVCIAEMYAANDVCMGEFLASVCVHGLSVEDTAELYAELIEEF